MRIGLFADGLGHLDLGAVLAWCAEREVRDLELGAGGYSPAPHLDAARLVADQHARHELLARLRDADVALAALNVSGNPLHPDPAVSTLHDQVLRDTLRLAAQLDVERVVAMSGCPGAPGGGSSVLNTTVGFAALRPLCG